MIHPVVVPEGLNPLRARHEWSDSSDGCKEVGNRQTYPCTLQCIVIPRSALLSQRNVINHLPMLDLEAQARLRVKAVTAVVTTITAASLILFDWDAASGQRTAFSSIRPTIKSWLNQVYGVEPRTPSPVQDRGA